MATTIQVSDDVQKALVELKLTSRETYNDVLIRILEDLQELDEQTLKELEVARKEIDAGKFKTHEEVGEELGFR